MPFSVILIVLPEIIPVIVMWFPSLLPSTFSSAHKAAMREKLLIRREDLARKLQGGMTKSDKAKPADFVFPDQIRSIFKRYPDGFLLSALSRESLAYTSKFFGVSTLAPSFLLRIRLRRHLLELKRDDGLILRDGLNRLSVEDLEDAVEARGM